MKLPPLNLLLDERIIEKHIMQEWIEKEILIIVKTYPEYSKKYTETVCTAGILADSKQLIRLYPLRFRYLNGDSQFSKYQWITAKIQKNTIDSRKESYSILENSIKMGKKIGTSDEWLEREKWVLSAQNKYSSLEALIAGREKSRVSLGIIRPKKINGLKIEHKTSEEINESELKKDSIIRQLDMLEDKKSLDLLPVKFVLNFVCDDDKCNGHNISILDWEIGELYRKVRLTANWEEKVRTKILKELCGVDRETYLIMGNMALHQHIFCILGFFYPPRRREQSLFD
jgi:hypothetical protein